MESMVPMLTKLWYGWVKSRSGYVLSPLRCDGKGCPNLVETTNCYSKCCPASCIYVSNRWSPGHGCCKMEEGQDSIMLLEKQNVGLLVPHPFSKLRNVVLESNVCFN